MIFDGKFLTILVFIAVNFLLIFFVKTRTSIVISLIIAHLFAVLFFSMSISSFVLFKEMVLVLIAYFAAILFLISNNNPIYLAKLSEAPKALKSKLFNKNLAGKFFAFLSLTAIFCAMILLISKSEEIAKTIEQKKSTHQEMLQENPLVAQSHPIHMTVKKIYFDKNFDESWLKNNDNNSSLETRKKIQLKEKIGDSFLFKRSSDVIILLVATISIMLILKNKNNES